MGIGSKFGITAETGNNIVTDGLVFNVDSSIKKSYPRTGTNVFNLASGSLTPTGSLINDVGWEGINPTSSFIFDGVDDSIVLSNIVDLGINSSISVWVNLDSNYTGVLLGSESYDSYYFIQARYNDFFVRIGSVYKSFPLTDNALTAGSWHHLVVTRSGDSISTYVDGNFIETKTGYGTSVTTKFDTIADRQTSSLPLEGKIANTQTYNKTFSASDVLQNYNAGKDRFGL